VETKDPFDQMMFGTRNFLEFRVGSNMSVECVVHLRRADLEWFNGHRRRRQDNDEEPVSEQRGKKKAAHNPRLEEIKILLQTSILPRMFSSEIEIENAKQMGIKNLPPELGPGGVPVQAGEKNTEYNSNGRKRKRMTKKQFAEAEREKEKTEERKKKDIYYVFGKQVRLAYRLQDFKSKPSETLVFDNKNSGQARDGRLRALSKVSKPILIWCFPIDDDKDDFDSGASLVRPQFIPMAELFRHPNQGKRSTAS